MPIAYNTHTHARAQNTRKYAHTHKSTKHAQKHTHIHIFPDSLILLFLSLLSLLSLSPGDPYRFDLRLLAVAKRLCPMIHDAFQGVKEEITQMAIRQVCVRACLYERARVNSFAMCSGKVCFCSFVNVRPNLCAHCVCVCVLCVCTLYV